MSAGAFSKNWQDKHEGERAIIAPDDSRNR
jgi:hypothetical protein